MEKKKQEGYSLMHGRTDTENNPVERVNAYLEEQASLDTLSLVHHLRLGRRRRVDARSGGCCSRRAADSSRTRSRQLRSDSREDGDPGRRDRLRAPGRRARRGAGSRASRDRRRVPVLLDRPAEVHRRRHAGPRAVHPEHGDRGLDGRRRGDPDRRAPGRPDTGHAGTR